MNKNVFEIQNTLQQQAEDMLNRLDLIGMLSRYGEVRIVGSMALGLMTWPDIDIDVESASGINDEDYFEIVQYIFGQRHVKQLILMDNRNSVEKNRPQSIYIGVIYTLNEVDWKIDLRYLNPSAAWAGDDVNRIKSRLTPENTKAILEIKTAFHDHPKYGREFSGYDIYHAVLDRNVSTVQVFRDDVLQRGIVL